MFDHCYMFVFTLMKNKLIYIYFFDPWRSIILGSMLGLNPNNIAHNCFPFLKADELFVLTLRDTVVVFNLNKPGNISKAIRGERVGTFIGGTRNSVTARAWRKHISYFDHHRSSSISIRDHPEVFMRQRKEVQELVLDLF